METGGGRGNAWEGFGDDADPKALLESGSGCHLHQHPFEQSRGDMDPRLPAISANVIIRKRVPYLIALTLACFLLYHSFNHFEYYFPNAHHPFSGPSENNTTLSSSSLVFNNSSAASAQENLHSNTSSPTDGPANLPSSSASEETEEEKLAKVLNKAAMENKTVIVTTVNAAWAEPNSLFDLFLESFKIGIETQKLLNHLVVIALDQRSYNRCSELHTHCCELTTDGIDFSAQEAFFMQPDYVELVWRKIEFMYTVLQLGYSAVFTDADIMWFRDPFLHFLEDVDMQTASDHYSGSPVDGISNSVFYYVKSNNRTLQFYDLWLTSRKKFEGKHDQDVFNMLRDDPATVEIGIKIRVLDTAFYGGFCESSEDLNLVCTMHANCCAGLGTKLRDLRLVLEDWKSYMALPGEERVNTPHTWTHQRNCHG